MGRLSENSIIAMENKSHSVTAEIVIFSGDETTDVGSDSATPVSDDYGPKDSAFIGRVRWVRIDIDEAVEDLDHLITPEERLRIPVAPVVA